MARRGIHTSLSPSALLVIYNNDTSSHTVHYHIGWQPVHTHTRTCTCTYTYTHTHTHTHTLYTTTYREETQDILKKCSAVLLPSDTLNHMFTT